MAKSIIQNDATIFRRYSMENLMHRCNDDFIAATWRDIQQREVEQGPHIYGYVYRIDIIGRDLYYIGQQRGPLDLFYRGHGIWISNYVKAHGLEDLFVTVLGWAYDKEGLNAAEYFILGDRYKTDPRCMNLTCGGGSKPGNGHLPGEKFGKRVLSKETRERIRISNLGQTRSEEARKHIGEAMKKVFSNQEIRAKISRALIEYHKNNPDVYKGRSCSEETRAKISASHTGRKLPPFTQEHKDKIRAAQVGYLHWTNGRVNLFCKNCPEGFWRGTTPKDQLIKEEK